MALLNAASITKRVSLSNGDVVLVDDTNDLARNIFLLDRTGEVIWQIEPATMSHGVVGFSDLYLGTNSELLAYSSNGIEYIIDNATGKILNKELIR